MKISVAMAVFNGETYIEEQLESIYRQSRQPDEVIISDDHSTDRTKQIVKAFIQERDLQNWTLIGNDGSRGVSHNFVNALRHISGDIFFLCDQDDVWEKNKVETMAAALEQEVDLDREPETTCVISAIRYIDQNGKEILDRTSYTNDQDHVIDLEELCSVCSYLGMAAAFRSTVLSSTDEKFMSLTAHDWALMVTAAKMGQVRYLGAALQRYRQHTGNASVVHEGSRKEKRLAFIRRQAEMIHRTMPYACGTDVEAQMEGQAQGKENDRERTILNVYETFLMNRMGWIEKRNFMAVVRHYQTYKRLKYTKRNFLADVAAALG